MGIENRLQLFNYEGRSVRTIVIDGNPWWVAKDVCDILGLNNVSQAIIKIRD
jgi:anti-repressor protein